MPEVTFVTTTTTEQVGTESVRVGSSFNTADVTLTQLGYYNPNAAAFTILAASQELQPGQGISSPNGFFRLNMQGDGNLVLYGQLGATWSTGTFGQSVRAVMQDDGNFVLYNGGSTVWSTGTAGHPGAYLALQNDGNLVIYAPGDVALWASNTSNLSQFRKTFVEGIDYRNGSVDWSKVYDPLTGDIQTLSTFTAATGTTEFGALTDNQRDSVLIQLGYRKYYNVSFANLTTNNTINGIPSQIAWNPSWNNYTTQSLDTLTGQVTLFGDSNYGGDSESLAVGNYAQVARNDFYSSLKVPAGFRVTVYRMRTLQVLRPSLPPIVLTSVTALMMRYLR